MNFSYRLKAGLRGFYTSGLLMCIIIISQLILIPIYLKELGNDVYGVYIIIAQIISYITYFDFGLGTTLLKYYGDNKISRVIKGGFSFKENLEIVSNLNLGFNSSFWIYFVIGGSISLILGVSSDYLVSNFDLESSSVEVSRFIQFMAFSSFLNFLLKPFLIILFSTHRQTLSNYIQICTFVIQNILIYILLHKGFGLWAFVFGSLSTFFVTALILIANPIRETYFAWIKFSLKCLDKKIFLKLFGYSSKIFLIGFLAQGIYYSDKIIAGLLLSVGTVTSFSLMIKFSEILMSVSNKFIDNLIPFMMEVGTENHKLSSQLFVVIFKIMSIMSLSFIAFLLLYQEYLLKIWVDTDFYGLEFLILTLITFLLVHPFVYLGRSFLISKNLISYVARLTFLEFFINVVLTIVLVYFYEIFGTILATFISGFVISGIFLFLKINSIVQADFLKLLKKFAIYVLSISVLVFFNMMIFPDKQDFDIWSYELFYSLSCFILSLSLFLFSSFYFDLKKEMIMLKLL